MANTVTIFLMKNILKNINKAFDNKVRLGIMAAIMVDDYLDFN